MAETPRVVLAEDDRDIRTLVTRTLADEFELATFENGRACWEHLQESAPPDVLLLDVSLPGMDGLELYDRVGASDRLAGVTVVFLTGRNEADVVSEVGEDVSYIAKPFSPSDFRERIQVLSQ